MEFTSSADIALALLGVVALGAEVFILGWRLLGRYRSRR
jgi:hypothetical protein